MSIQLLDIPCPKCEALCWVNNGDIDDLTLPDIEAIKCWHCTHWFWVEDSFIMTNLSKDYTDQSYETAKEALEH